MKRSITISMLLALAVLLVGVTTAMAKGDVFKFAFNDSGSATDTDLCGFALEVAWDIDNFTVGRLAGATDDTQVWGHHAIRGSEVWSNQENGRSVTIHMTSTLARTEIDFSGLVIDEQGRWQGTVTAVDQYSGNYVGTVPGYGQVMLSAGHAVALHSSTFVDDVRIARTDDLIFNAGPTGDPSLMCEYLAGS